MQNVKLVYISGTKEVISERYNWWS